MAAPAKKNIRDYSRITKIYRAFRMTWLSISIGGGELISRVSKNLTVLCPIGLAGESSSPSASWQKFSNSADFSQAV